MSINRYVKRRIVVPLTALFLVSLGQTPEGQFSDFVPVTDAMLQSPSADDWLMWRRTLDGWGYSPLDQITRENVDQLRMVWTRGLLLGPQEGTPLAYDGVLYSDHYGCLLQGRRYPV